MSRHNKVYPAMRNSFSSSEDGFPIELFQDSQSECSFLDGMASLEADMASQDEDWDQHTLSQDFGLLPRLYNVTDAVTSDILVRFNGGRSEFLSQKAVLSAKSGYFERAFSGNFPVATSDVIDLGDDDNPKHIYAMLCFLHGTEYHKIHQRNTLGRNLDFHVDLYLIGEQFDIRSLRLKAAETFFFEANALVDTRWFPMAVQRVLGYEGPVFADPFLIELTIKIIMEKMEYLVKNDRFMEMVKSGELADEDMMIKLFLALGERIRDMSRLDVWVSKEERLLNAQREMLAAEADMGDGPWDASTLGGQIMAARAQNAAHAALTNLALLVPQPTFAPPPAILTSHRPAPVVNASAHVSRPVVKTSFTKMFVHHRLFSEHTLTLSQHSSHRLPAQEDCQKDVQKKLICPTCVAELIWNGFYAAAMCNPDPEAFKLWTHRWVLLLNVAENHTKPSCEHPVINLRHLYSCQQGALVRKKLKAGGPWAAELMEKW
ncbi:hypothetical protein E4T49_07136 [Aureobasidium sp. EXF-10728]|nr:hypothetical protein E4T49_07136 [Aureobasidium sp. EXF-10728]